jgi:hypothetical protein
VESRSRKKTALIFLFLGLRVIWAVNRPMSGHSPLWLYGTLQMRIVMFFANSDHTHLDHNSAIN